MRLAVVVTTYNRPDALAAVLAAFGEQSDRDLELLVADDGSGPETAAVVEAHAARAPYPVEHVWQEDVGFRAAAIRNRALARTTADYVVFTDGDCVPPVGFVAMHRQLAEPGWFLSGNRLMLSRELTERVLREELPIHRWRARDWLRARRRGGIERVLPLIRLGDSPLRKAAPRRWQGAKTCNLSAFRSDLLRVNGLDESYVGWGLEDSDLVVRLIRGGVGAKSARFAVPVLHLWHRENDRSQLAENRRRLDEVIGASHVRARLGVDRYLVPGEPGG